MFLVWIDKHLGNIIIKLSGIRMVNIMMKTMMIMMMVVMMMMIMMMNMMMMMYVPECQRRAYSARIGSELISKTR